MDFMRRDRIAATLVLTAVFMTISVALAAAQVSPDGFDPAAVSKKAEEAMNAREFEKAAGLFRQLSEKFPDIAGVKMNLGMALYFSGKPADALNPLTEASEKDPSLESAWFFAALAFMDTGQPERALNHFQEYLKRKPIDYDARLMYAEALSALQRFEEAVEEYQAVLKARPENAKAWFGIGKGFEGLSTQHFDKLDSIAPESAYWLALVADSRVVQKQLSSAYFLYREALEREPSLRGVHYSISRIYRERGHDDWATVEEKKEGELGPPDCANEKLVCYFLQGNFSRIAAEGDPDKPADLYWMIQAYNQLAIASFTRLNELPSSLEVHTFRARVQENLGRYWDSIKEWKLALEYAPGDVFIRKQLAINLYFNRNYAEANKIIQEMLKFEPNDARLNFLAGDILVYEQQAEQAIPYLTKAVKADDSYIPAHSSLGRALMSLNRAEEAIPHLEKALETDDDGSVHYQLARAYQRSGEREKARSTMQEFQAALAMARHAGLHRGF